MNATSGNISPNPEGSNEDDKEIAQESKSMSRLGCSNVHHSNLSRNVSNQMEEDKDESKEEIKEYISDDEEEEYEEVDDDEEDIKSPMPNINPNSEMSLEEARYALQHIKNEASSSSSINEENKKILKPPYR